MGWNSISSEEYIWIFFSCFSTVIYGLICHIIITSRKTNQNSLFHAPFFNISLVQAFHGLSLSFTINFVMRPRKFRLIVYPITDDSPLVEYTYYWYSFLKCNLFLSYVVIAANRMTVFFFETRYKKMWTPVVIFIITMICYAFLILLRLVTYSPDYKFATTVDFSADIFMFVVPPAMDIFDNVLDIVLSLGSGSICTVLYLITAYKAKKSAITGSKRKREMIILRSAFVTFLLMLPSAIRGAVQIYAIAYEDVKLKTMSNRAATYFIEIMFVAEPWVLVLTFPSIRQKMSNMVGSITLSGSSVIENSGADTHNNTVRTPMFTITR